MKVVKWKCREDEFAQPQAQNLSVVWAAKISDPRDTEMRRRFCRGASTTTITGEQSHGTGTCCHRSEEAVDA